MPSLYNMFVVVYESKSRIGVFQEICTYVHERARMLQPGSNPTIESYYASAVKIYNATSSLVPFENKHLLPTLKKTL
jgi:hypothetical protein